MRVTRINPDALQKTIRRLQGVGRGPDETDLMALGREWQAIMVEDNRKGVLSGTDKDDKPAPPLRYRMGKGRRTAARRAGFGRAAKLKFYRYAGSQNNLTTAEYQKLTGPRLAPRRANSRTITNHATEVRTSPRGVHVIGTWADVVDKSGRPFLQYHFNGTVRLERYDLRGVRQWGKTRALAALRDWVRHLVKLRLSA